MNTNLLPPPFFFFSFFLSVMWYWLLKHYFHLQLVWLQRMKIHILILVHNLHIYLFIYCWFIACWNSLNQWIASIYPRTQSPQLAMLRSMNFIFLTLFRQTTSNNSHKFLEDCWDWNQWIIGARTNGYCTLISYYYYFY